MTEESRTAADQWRSAGREDALLVLVGVVFEGPVDTDPDVVRLLLGELGHDATEALHHVGGDLFIEVFREHLHRNRSRTRLTT